MDFAERLVVADARLSQDSTLFLWNHCCSPLLAGECTESRDILPD